MVSLFKRISALLARLFKKRKLIKIGLYGPPNSGKTTLANKICMDWLGQEMGSVSNIPHETQDVCQKEKVSMQVNGKTLAFTLVDTPGIATRIDYEDFLAHGLDEKDAKQRARNATKGVIEAIKWLDQMDVVIIVLDSTKSPYTQVNITIIGNLEARKIPIVIAANKTDLKRSDSKRIAKAFPLYPIIPISAKNGDRIDQLYESIANAI